MLAIVCLSPKAEGEISRDFRLSPFINDLDLSEPVTSDSLAYLEAPRTIPTLAVRPYKALAMLDNPNILLGQQIALENGYSDTDWQCLYTLGMRESGWNHLAKNKTSGAFGIPQSLPASKLDAYGDRTDPTVQIRWFIDYVSQHYQSSCNALKHSLAVNWY